MPIEEVTTTSLAQRCSSCSAVRHIPLDTLSVGIAMEGIVDECIVPLPACSTCRSTEFLIRTPDGDPKHPSPSSVGGLHRLLVDHVHAELVMREQVIPELRVAANTAGRKLARPPAADEMTQWFPDGLRIERRSERGAQEQASAVAVQEPPVNREAQ